MAQQQNAPALAEREGVVCLLGGDIDVHKTAAVRAQVLMRHGVPSHRSGLVAALHYGEARE